MLCGGGYFCYFITSDQPSLSRNIFPVFLRPDKRVFEKNVVGEDWGEITTIKANLVFVLDVIITFLGKRTGTRLVAKQRLLQPRTRASDFRKDTTCPGGTRLGLLDLPNLYLLKILCMYVSISSE